MCCSRCILLVLFILCRRAYGQDSLGTSQSITISTDRPSMCYAASVMPNGAIQFEIGYSLIRERGFYTESNLLIYDYRSHSLPNILLRTGASNSFELRALVDNTVVFYPSRLKPASLHQGFQLGYKWLLHNEKKEIPQVVWISGLSVLETVDQYTTVFTRLLFQNTLSDRFSLTYNLGYRRMLNGYHENRWMYSLMSTMNLINGLSMAFEPYGELYVIKDTKPFYRQHLQMIFIYVHQKRYQFDLCYGYGFRNKGSEFENYIDWALQIGFSYLIYKQKNKKQ